jgi:hypothetical protein
MEIPRDQRGFMYTGQVMGHDKLIGVATSRGYGYYSSTTTLQTSLSPLALGFAGNEVNRSEA